MKAQKPATPLKKDPNTMGTFFEKENFKWMLIGAGVLILGFILMGGGASHDPNVFNAKEVYSTTRITIAPFVILTGFVIEIVAIFRKPNRNTAS